MRMDDSSIVLKNVTRDFGVSEGDPDPCFFAHVFEVTKREDVPNPVLI